MSAEKKTKSKPPAESLTPMMRQYLQIKSEAPDALLFYRMGDFYEMFFEDAEIAAPILGVALTSRDKKGSAERIPLCGVPYHSADGYLAKLIRAGHKVAVCEQTEDPKAAKGLVKREIVRIVTPGMTLSESTLEDSQPNHLAALHFGKRKNGDRTFGLAALEFSTGEFRAAESASLEAIAGEIARLAPAEMLFERPDDDSPEIAQAIAALSDQNPSMRIEYLEPELFAAPTAVRRLTDRFGVRDLSGFGLTEGSSGAIAAGALLAYAETNERGGLAHVHRLSRYDLGDGMTLDAFTQRNLELVAGLADGSKKGTLLGLLDRTKTPMGARTLRKWVTMPLADIESIHARLDALESLLDSPDALDALRDALGGVRDIERLMTRVVAGAANARDLRALAESLKKTPEIAVQLDRIAGGTLAEIAGRFDCHAELCALLDGAIAMEPPIPLKDGGIVREGYDAELDEMRETARSGRAAIARFEEEEKERVGFPIKVGYNKVFGYYIEATHRFKDRIPESYIRKQTLVNAERYITEELKRWEERILSAKEESSQREFEIFQELRRIASRSNETLGELAQNLATLDALASLAHQARKAGYQRPEIVEENALHIVDGRHPVIESLSLGEPFVPNDCVMSDERRILLITGPNMAGKSTYMRQIALIVLMAHMGSFVPAASAKIGLTDRIFTRVGASDQLSRGLSTFMVEMNETAEILHCATNRSLVVLDEIGRGTSTYDGISIAWAVAEHLLEKIGARTLFATHYHELAELATLYEPLANVHVAVKEWKNEVLFLRRVQEGASPHSYGIKVARLAGLPPAVLERAENLLRNLEEERETDRDRLGRPTMAKDDRKGEDPKLEGQLALFAGKSSATLEKLKAVDIDQLTPVEALNRIAELREAAFHEVN